MATVLELPIETYDSVVDPDWCPGCGDFGVLKSLKMAAGRLGIQPKDLFIVSGIGCSSNLPGFIHAYGVHSLHGRAVAVASGVKFANHNLHVVITGGDGDGYGIGIGHFIHAMRRNLDLTYIVMNNQIYGLTTGQASPTTMKEVKTKSTPRGNVEQPINPIALALVSGATYISRAFSGEPNHMADIIAGAIVHRGFALVDVFSPCVTYNKINTYPWFKQRVYQLEKEAGYDAGDYSQAMEKSGEWGDRIPIGLFYKGDQAIYEDSEPALKHGPLVHQTLGMNSEVFQSLVAEMV
ncbi:MAG: thiamine pyrophosphate-dependent enzyme [Acidobacteria bacterium]|nr:thiamine pyrophosphate-dependent enzyme [Acidobacteriota bacterium]MCI0620824.1 thiamine pyrophosphate-dependent enzyme [Acidobacteriota bacterium]MCI0721023.1 thiamine pyrophosphate-dependent enzyme [Acidobacteriota bacterium]